MKLASSYTLKDIAALIGCEFEGNPKHIVSGLLAKQQRLAVTV